MIHNYTKEFSYNLKLAYPVILGMIGHIFVSFADNVMVGQLGAAELAAVSLGNSFFFIAMSLGIGFSTAITPIIAEADSSNNIKEGKNVFIHGLLLCTILSVILFGIILLLKPVMYYMEQPKEVVELAIPYLNYVALSLIPLIIFQAMKQFSDGLSMTKYPMYATILANIINIALNYLLIFGTFGFPKLGITGAAIGTLVSRVVMVIFLWIIFKSKDKFKPYITNLNFRNIKSSIINKIANLGFPSALQMFFTAAIWISGVLGKNPQAANQIALNLSSMTFMVGIGLSVAAMVRVGNQKGLSDFVYNLLIAFSILLTVSCFPIIATVGLFTGLVMGLQLYYTLIKFGAESALGTAVALSLIRELGPVLTALMVVGQAVKIPALITFISYWIIGFPICFYLGLYTPLKSVGIWIGLFVGLFLKELSSKELYVEIEKLILNKN